LGRAKVSIADRVRAILPEAVQRVSNGGKMKFDIRSLYYAVREIYLKRWPGEKFYKYNSFTQDFMRSHERRHGKIPNMVRGPRGSYAAPDEYGWRTQEPVKPGMWLYRGVGNKVLVVEKMGLYEQMVANDFDRRLDAIIMTTQGFTTEAGRLALIQAQDWGLPIVILHDYDINGVLIKETLARPTKRIKQHVDPTKLVDAGINWQVVEELMEARGLTPEPVKLGKEDRAKLEGLLERGDITPQEYEFLRVGRVELNALTPMELMKWLEARLEELGLWKTTPTQEQLDQRLRAEYVRCMTETLTKEVKDQVGLNRLLELIQYIENGIARRVEQVLKEEELPTRWEVEEFVEEMRKNVKLHWAKLADRLARDMAEEEEEMVEEHAEEIVKDMADIEEALDQAHEILSSVIPS